MRLVVAVTVLSLAISPLWVVTARRLHNLTTNVNTLTELLSSIYAHEANIVAMVASRIRPQIAFTLPTGENYDPQFLERSTVFAERLCPFVAILIKFSFLLVTRSQKRSSCD